MTIKTLYINLEPHKFTKDAEDITDREEFKNCNSNIILCFDDNERLVGIEILGYHSIEEDEVYTANEVRAGFTTIMTYDERIQFLKDSGLGELYGFKQDE